MADITRWDPFNEMLTFRNSLDRLFDDISPLRFRPLIREIDLTFPIDVYEDDENVTVKALLPGIKPSDIDVSVVGNLLTLRGQMREEQEQDNQNYYRREVRAGNFMRQIALPCEVVSDKSQATYEDGVLRIKLPKAEQVKPKSIKVQSRNTIEGKSAPSLSEGKQEAQRQKGEQQVKVQDRQ